MIVTLDAAALEESFSPDLTLQALIDDVRETHLGQRIVVGVEIDGQTLVDHELSQRLPLPLGETQRVELVSADVRELAANALNETADQLGAAGDDYASVARQFNAGNVAEAVSGFGGFLSAWQVCQRVILECSRLLGRDLTEARCAGATVREHLDGLAAKLRELRDAFEARDTVLLADMAQYEMPEICEQWRGILGELAADVAAPAANSTP